MSHAGRTVDFGRRPRSGWRENLAHCSFHRFFSIFLRFCELGSTVYCPSIELVNIFFKLDIAIVRTWISRQLYVRPFVRYDATGCGRTNQQRLLTWKCIRSINSQTGKRNWNYSLRLNKLAPIWLSLLYSWKNIARERRNPLYSSLLCKKKFLSLRKIDTSHQNIIIRSLYV